MKNILIVGAGMSGLSFAYECLLRGHRVTLVEADKTVGGLAKSIFYAGCYLDIGVHIFYGKDKEVHDKLREVVKKNQWVKVKRNGKLYVQNRYIDWPLKYTALFQFPVSLGIHIVTDQLFKKKPAAFTTPNYHDEVLSLYGPSLYYAFFHPLTSKFLKTDPRKIHADWAFSTIRAATKIEDKAFAKSYKYLTQTTDQDAKKAFNILKFVINSITTSRNDEPFYYFKHGYGTIPKAYETKILKLGGVIKTSSRVEKFILKNGVIKKCVINGVASAYDEVVWTCDPYALCTLLNFIPPTTQFLHTKYVYFLLKRCLKDYQVCYCADPDISFVRATILSNHAKTIITNKQVSDVLCLEYSFKTKEQLFRDSTQLRKQAIKDMQKMGIITDEDDIHQYYEINVPNSYPVLTIDYRKQLQKLQRQVTRVSNLLLFGRQARFNYENVDVIIKEAINHPFFSE